MKLKDIKDVLTFAAFRPEPDDSSAPWLKRFPHERTLLLNISRNFTTWRCMGKGGKLLDGGSHKGDFKEMAASMDEEWKPLTDNGWCAVSINSRYVISLETNLSRKKGAEEVIRTNPRAALGTKSERGKRYALTHNPESVSSILLACDEELVKKIETTLRDLDLSAGRICCGTYTMLRRMLERINQGKKTEEPEKEKNILCVVCNEGSVCALVQEGENWTELRSRTDLYEETNTEPVIDILRPLIERCQLDGVPTELYFASDQEGSPIVENLNSVLRDVKITDVTTKDHLWTTIAERT